MGFYDGFETGTLSSQYTFENSTIQASVVSTPTPPTNCGTYCLRAYRSGGGGETVSHAIYRTDVTLSAGNTYNVYLARTSSSFSMNFLFGGTAYSDCYEISVGSNSVGSWVVSTLYVGNSGSAIVAEDKTLGPTVVAAMSTAGSWVRLQIDWAAGGGYTFGFYNMSNTLLGYTKSTTDATYTSGGFGWACANPQLFNSSSTQFGDAIPLSGGSTSATITDTQKTASGIFLPPTASRTIGARTLTGTTESNYVHLSWS